MRRFLLYAFLCAGLLGAIIFGIWFGKDEVSTEYVYKVALEGNQTLADIPLPPLKQLDSLSLEFEHIRDGTLVIISFVSKSTELAFPHRIVGLGLGILGWLIASLLVGGITILLWRSYGSAEVQRFGPPGLGGVG